MKHYIFFICYAISLIIAKGQNIQRTMLRLPDTGEINSYTATFGEDNDFNIFPPFFIINGNGTVTDTITGLMWQQSDGGEMTIESAVLYCNNLVLGGYTDWRLPNAHEAFSILNHQYANPALDAGVFTNSNAEYWWTYDRQANDSNKIWATNAGGGIGNHPKSETISAGGTKRFHVRAVRDITIPLNMLNQFIDNANGTITDLLTDLIWQKIPYQDSLTWEQSLSYADTLSLAGYTDWRLPNIKELQSINDEKIINPSINTNYFVTGGPKKYWSSTTLPNQTSKAWYMNTQFGITTYDTKTWRHNLIMVRGNPVLTSRTENTHADNIIYPNPFSKQINIQHKTGTELFELKDISGAIIYFGKDIDAQDFSSLSKGIYFLRISYPSNEFFKLVKQ